MRCADVTGTHQKLLVASLLSSASAGLVGAPNASTVRPAVSPNEQRTIVNELREYALKGCSGRRLWPDYRSVYPWRLERRSCCVNRHGWGTTAVAVSMPGGGRATNRDDLVRAQWLRVKSACRLLPLFNITRAASRCWLLATRTQRPAHRCA